EPLRPGSENPTWEVTKPDVGGYEARCLCQTQKRMEIACPVGGWWGYVQAKRPRLATEILFRAPLYVPPRMHENRFPVDRQGFERLDDIARSLMPVTCTVIVSKSAKVNRFSSARS